MAGGVLMVLRPVVRVRAHGDDAALFALGAAAVALAFVIDVAARRALR